MAAKLTELGRTTESHTVADEDLEEAHGAAADACCLLAKAALVVGHLPDAERWIGEAFELAHTHGIVDLPHVGYYYVMVGALHARRGEFAPADHAIGLGLEQMQGQAD